MTGPPLVTILINNYNYEPYLADAIDSALAQRYDPVEVLVVDDGSTDGSRAMLQQYGDRIRTVLKSNGGQASAFNAGIAAARGLYVLLLDADDRLKPEVAAQVVAAFTRSPTAAMVNYRLQIVDGAGRPTGTTKPPAFQPLPAGDLRPRLLAAPDDIAFLPTSGNAFRAEVLRALAPLPEEAFRLCADTYLLQLAPLHGPVLALDGMGGDYRAHGANRYHHEGITLAESRSMLSRGELTHDAIRHHAKALDLADVPVSNDHFFSFTLALHRLLSWRLERGSHPYPADSRHRLLARGLQAAWRRPRARQRLPLALLFVAATLLPRPLMVALVERFFFPERGRAAPPRTPAASQTLVDETRP